MKARESVVVRIQKPFDLKEIVQDGFQVGNQSMEYLMDKVGKTIWEKSVVKRVPVFACKLSIAGCDRIVEANQANPG